MSHFITFLDLLGRLLAQGSSWSRMKLLSQLWQFLSRLDREQRRSLLLELGLQEGEQLIDRFLSAPGSHSGEVVAWADELIRAIDPVKVEQLAREKLGPEEARALTSALSLFAAKKPLAQRQTETERKEEVTEKPEEKSSSPPPIPEEPPPPPEAAGSAADERLSSSPSPASPPSEPETAASPPPEAVAESPARPASKETVSDREKAEASLSPSSGAGSSPETADASADPPSVASPAATQAGEEPDFIRSLRKIWNASRKDAITRRYRAARDLLRRQERLDLPLAEEIIDSFSPGWMRRRLLVGIFEDHSRDEAVVRFLIGKLGAASDFRWFAGALLKQWEPLPLPVEEFLSRVPTASLRHSLAGKLHPQTENGTIDAPRARRTRGRS